MEGIELARTEERSNISRICVYPRNNIESHNSTKWSANRAIFKILFPNTIFYRSVNINRAVIVIEGTKSGKR